MATVSEGWEVLHERCAGIDIGKADCKVNIQVPGKGGRIRSEVRTFSTMTDDLLELRAWLLAEGITVVGMEATSSYWKPVFYVLEDALECWLLNAQHIKNVPGRKTDVNDAQWICRLVRHGLVRPSFVPPPQVRQLRDTTRYRTQLNQELTRHIQRLEKFLEDAGIKLSVVVTDITGKSARAMLEALVAGERDPERLAELALGSMRGKIPVLSRALAGRFTSHHAFMVRAMLDQIDATRQAIAHLTEEIDRQLEPYRRQIELLSTIAGVSTTLAAVILAEIGTDMSRFRTAGHLASWAGMCPGNYESAGKSKPGRTRHGDSWLKGALGMAASSAARTKNTYLNAQYRRLVPHRGKKRALVAVGHSILVSVWHMLTNDIPYQDLGPEHFTKRINTERRAHRLLAELSQLGYDVTAHPRTEPA
jgi:transposase